MNIWFRSNSILKEKQLLLEALRRKRFFFARLAEVQKIDDRINQGPRRCLGLCSNSTTGNSHLDSFLSKELKEENVQTKMPTLRVCVGCFQL